MALADAGARDFVIDTFIEDWQRGRSTVHDARRILDQFRLLGDVARLERLSRMVSDGGQPSATSPTLSL